tara:strand:- start:18950 stop:19495 length:546 start_codon:yes stop_codon:yes gene_type:complete
MLVKPENNENKWERPGERLVKILDEIGFPEGYGRMIKLQEVLILKNKAAFSSLSYSAVKSWFSDRAPTMSRIDDVFDALAEDYPFPNDQRLIKSWWKVGGFYPFKDELDENGIKDISTKLEIKLSVIISNLMGESFADVSTEDLKTIKNKALGILEKFADPVEKEPDDDTLAVIVRGILSK